MEEDHLSHDNFKKNYYLIIMKKIIILISAFILFNSLALAAGGDSGSSSTKASMYDEAVKLIKRAGKLEKKDNTDKAIKLYKEAFNKLEKADKKDKNNPDILNYMGFTSRKSGNFDEAEKFYLKGLSLNPNHNGINEYLGELYVTTNRHNLAIERLEVLKGCNCDEYDELKSIIAGEKVSKY